MDATTHTMKFIALAADYALSAKFEEQKAATIEAAAWAKKAGLDIWDLCEGEFWRVDPTCTVPWTEEPPPEGVRFEARSTLGRVGCTLSVLEASEGVWVEAYAGGDQNYRLLGRGFWRDHDVQEAVWLACDAWGI